MDFFPIGPGEVADFLRFFDCSAFPEGDEWAGCYCLEGSCDRHFEIAFTDRKIRRETAAELVRSGRLRGYLIRENGRDIGWVKIGDKLDFSAFRDWYHGEMPSERGHTAVLYCIDLIPEYRGKGFSRKILDFAVHAATESGFKILEAYPSADPTERRNYRGHQGLYLSAGFIPVAQCEDFYIMQKPLSRPD